MVIEQHGAQVADLPIDPLALASPEYDRPWLEPKIAAPIAEAGDLGDPIHALRELMGSANIASKRWIYEQYDQRVAADTLAYSGGDAGIVRIHGTDKAAALTTDCRPHFCLANPERGAAHGVAEAYRNLCAVGAKPLAVTNNLNYGNPEKPEIMGQIGGGEGGWRKPAIPWKRPSFLAMYPFITKPMASPSCPPRSLAPWACLPQASRRVGLAYASAGIPLVRLGPPPRPGDLGQSAYLRDVLNDTSGIVPRLDLKLEKRSGDLVRRAINAGWVEACHDVAEGGLLVAVSEMALASHMGADISRLDASAPAYFGEPCATYILAVPEPALILAEVSHQGLQA